MEGRSWSPPFAITVITLVLGLAAGTAAALGATEDKAGRLLLGLAAVVLLGLTAHGALARPRLAADGSTVTVRGMLNRHSWSWDSVRVDVRYTRRLGRRQVTLELDGVDAEGVERLAVLGRLELGADPEEVAAELSTLRAGEPL